MTQHITKLTIWKNATPVPDGVPGEYDPKAVYVTINHLDGHKRIYCPSVASHRRLVRLMDANNIRLAIDLDVTR
jgi:hypothetical protein